MTHTGDRRSLRISKNPAASRRNRIRYNEDKARGICPLCRTTQVQGRVVCEFCVDSVNSRRDLGVHLPSSHFRKLYERGTRAGASNAGC